MVVVAVAGVWLLGGGWALAQESHELSQLGPKLGGDGSKQVDVPRGAYRAAIELALQYFRDRRWLEAREEFERAHRLRPSARTWRGIAFATFYLGDYPSSAHAFEQALAATHHRLTPQQRQECQDYLARAQARAGRLHIHVEPGNARIRLDDHPVQADQRHFFLAPGAHQARMEHEGYEPAVTQFQLVEGQQLELHVALSRTATKPKGIPPVATGPIAPVLRGPAGSPVPPERGIGPGKIAPWLAGGATVGLCVAAVSFGLAARNAFKSVERACRRQGCDVSRRSQLWHDADVGTYKALTTASLIGAGVGLAATVALFAWQSQDEGAPMTVMSIGPGGVMLSRRF